MSGILKVGGSELINDNGGSGSLHWGSSVPKGSVIEQFMSPCDGSPITVQSGTYNIENVTTEVQLTNTHEKILGSEISYTPPTGTQTVVYEFSYQRSHVDAATITHWKLHLDSDEVTNFRTTFSEQGNHLAGRFVLKWAFHIGGSANTATGRVASWTSAKAIKLTARNYSSIYEAKLHQTGNWDGSSSVFSQPTIAITALA